MANSDQQRGRTSHQMAKGLPPKAQLTFAFTAIIAGISIALRFRNGGMEASLALPLGLFIGITGISLVTAALWAISIWVRGRID